MNPAEDLLRKFQDLVAVVPEIVQPFVVMLAGMIPFVEGEGATSIGILGGIHPLVAGVAAAVGNYLAIIGVVLFGSRVREALVARRARRATAGDPVPVKPESKGRQRFRRYLVRFGVPGASLLGPLAIPTHFTTAMLIASGTARRWVLIWQGVAVVLWTTVTTAVVWGVVTATGLSA